MLQQSIPLYTISAYTYVRSIWKCAFSINCLNNHLQKLEVVYFAVKYYYIDKDTQYPNTSVKFFS